MANPVTSTAEIDAMNVVATIAAAADNSKELVFTEQQLVALITSIFQSVNTRISDRIVNAVTSDDVNHVPSGDAVFKHVASIASETLNSAQGYADNKASGLDTTLKAYADNSASTKATAAQTAATEAAKNYTDNQISETKTYAESKATAAQTAATSAAQTYTDTQISSAKSYADTKASAAQTNAVNTAQGYTDSECAKKANKKTRQAFTITTTGWSDSSDYSDYPKHYDITVSGLTENDFVNTILDGNSLKVAGKAGVASFTKINTGAVRIYAASVPDANMTGVMEITKA